jgi:hypothetical protein
MMDEVQKPSNSECYTPLSELFRFYEGHLINKRITYLSLKYMWNPKATSFITDSKMKTAVKK